MSVFTVLAFAALQAQSAAQQQATAQLPASPIAKLVVTPAKPVMIARDTLQLSAQALDASGRPVENVRYRYIGAGAARFEGRVDSTGLVRSGSTGTIPVTVVALVPGTRPVTQVVEVKMMAGPAASVRIDAPPPKLVVGQQVVLTGTAYSAAGDQREDKLAWRSSAPNVARVSSDGRLTARRGRQDNDHRDEPARPRARSPSPSSPTRSRRSRSRPRPRPREPVTSSASA